MGILRTEEKKLVRFLMNYDYNNILGRIKYVLGHNTSFFSEIKVKSDKIIWYTNKEYDYRSLSDANGDEKEEIEAKYSQLLEEYSASISTDSLLGPVLSKIITIPSNDCIFYSYDSGDLDIIVTGWGCEIESLITAPPKDDTPNQHEVIEDNEKIGTQSLVKQEFDVEQLLEVKKEDNSQNTNLEDVGIIQSIESLIKNELYKDAYNLCLDCIKKNIHTDYAQQKCEELIPILKKKAKAESRKNILLVTIITFIAMFMAIILSTM